MMRTLRLFVPSALFVTAVACNNHVPDDPGSRIYPTAGVIRGTVLYQGPRPCSANGHIIGNAILLIFDRRNPPPPNGLATLPANFVAVEGDVLFANEPRYTGTQPYCPKDHGFTDTVTATAPFAVSPMAPAQYLVESFFDYTGDFLPTFKFRELPEQGDIGGGAIDTADALKAINAGNPNYTPKYIPVEVGIAQPLQPGQTIPNYVLPSSGYVADNVNVALGLELGLTRPYFYAQGIQATYDDSGGQFHSTLKETVVQDSSLPATGDQTGIPNTAEKDPNYTPVLTIPQDLLVYSPPTPQDPDGANKFDQGFPHLKLVFGVPQAELPCATGSSCAPPMYAAPGNADPYHFQIASGGGLTLWRNAYFNTTKQQWTPLQIPEGGGLPMLWPLVILSKLVDDVKDATGAQDPLHPNDPAGLNAQGDATHPVVILQGITLLKEAQNNPLAGGPAQEDTILNTVLAAGVPLLGTKDTTFDTTTGLPKLYSQDHLTVALRPSVICFNHLFDGSADTRGTLVSPYSSNDVAAGQPANPPAQGLIVPFDLLTQDETQTGRFPVTGLVNAVQYGCMPTGRYAINVVYPDGQAWTVPNEAGACSGTEGTSDFGGLTCTLKPRPILYSQGNRAIVEIVATTKTGACSATPPSAGQPAQATPGDPAPASGGSFAVPAACLPTLPPQ
jgi:hypothetical protein